jgi:hypothetical protein
MEPWFERLMGFPEQGVGRYENDFTQGPACAVSAGAGTIYRNYWVPVNGEKASPHKTKSTV